MAKKLKLFQTGVIAAICVSFLVGCGAASDKTISVSVADLKTGTFSSGYDTVGEVKPETQVDLIPKYSGKVEKTYKEAGDEVSVGDILLQLDTTSVANQVKSAQAALDQTNAAVAQNKLQYQAAADNASVAYDTAVLAQQQAQNDYDNSKTLFDAGAVSKAALDAAELAREKANAASATAKTALDTARKNLAIYIQSGGADAAVSASETQLDSSKNQMDDYTVTSPIDGVVISKNTVEGGMTGQSPVYSVANIDRVAISTAVPKEEINKLSLGGKALVFYVDGSSSETQITAISNSANASNLYMVQVTVDNKDHAFKPGMDARIVFVEKQFSSLIVPFESVVDDGKDSYIFIALDNKVKKVLVNVLGKNSDEIAIEPISVDLSGASQVVTQNANLLKDGDTITIKGDQEKI